MPSLASSCFLPPNFITIFILIVCNFRSTASIYLTECSGTNFTSPSLYETHLTTLLSFLLTTTPTSPTLFTTASYPNSSSPLVFGLAQCRPDVFVSGCSLCLSESVKFATADVTDGCGNRKSATLRSNHCFLRYSDQPFFGVVNNQYFYIYGMGQNISSLPFRLSVEKLMYEGLIQAAVVSSIKFAVGASKNLDDRQSIYGMAWCSMDIERQSDCEQCLSTAMNVLLPDKVEGRVASLSCELRYGITQFFSIMLFPSSMNILPPPPTPPIHPQAPPTTGLSVTGIKEKRRVKVITIIAVSGAVVLVLFIIIFTILLQRSKRLPAAVDPSEGK